MKVEVGDLVCISYEADELIYRYLIGFVACKYFYTEPKERIRVNYSLNDFDDHCRPHEIVCKYEKTKTIFKLLYF